MLGYASACGSAISLCAQHVACRTGVVRRYNDCACTLALQRTTAGRPALHGGEPGQVRKEAAIADLRKCRGYGSPPLLCSSDRPDTLLLASSPAHVRLCTLRGLAGSRLVPGRSDGH